MVATSRLDAASASHSARRTVGDRRPAAAAAVHVHQGPCPPDPGTERRPAAVGRSGTRRRPGQARRQPSGRVQRRICGGRDRGRAGADLPQGIPCVAVRQRLRDRARARYLVARRRSWWDRERPRRGSHGRTRCRRDLRPRGLRRVAAHARNNLSRNRLCCGRRSTRALAPCRLVRALDGHRGDVVAARPELSGRARRAGFDGFADVAGCSRSPRVRSRTTRQQAVADVSGPGCRHSRTAASCDRRRRFHARPDPPGRGDHGLRLRARLLGIRTRVRRHQHRPGHRRRHRACSRAAGVRAPCQE